MPEALIDVVIPVFNAGRTVRGAVQSIQGQTLRDIRILVVDDGSTDDTGAILAELAREDPRIEVLTKPNGGIVDALNHGLQRCRARYLARHDGDDLAFADRFAKQVAYLEANADCVAVGCAVRHIDEDGLFLNYVVELPPPSNSDPLWAPATEPYIMHPFLMARLDAVTGVGGYRYIFHAEDTDLYWRLLEVGRLHNMPDILGEYRMHAASVSSASVRNARVAALNSQLSSLSALRRREQRPDLSFEKATLDECNQAEFLEPIFRIGARQLDAEEADYLELRLAAKLIELASYRPFELDLGDCQFIRNALSRLLHTLSAENRGMLTRMCNSAAARMASQGAIKNAMTLTLPGHYPGFLARVGFRTMLPRKLRHVVLRGAGRPTHYK